MNLQGHPTNKEVVVLIQHHAQRLRDFVGTHGVGGMWDQYDIDFASDLNVIKDDLDRWVRELTARCHEPLPTHNEPMTEPIASPVD